MHFGLLLSHLPHVAEARSHYDAMLSLEPATRCSKFKTACSVMLRHVRTVFA